MSIEKMNFRRWVHKVLPAVYDESLSYYELLCKVIAKLNETIDLSNDTAEGLKELQDYVANYFDNLDIQEEINNKLDEMAQSGELTEIISQYIQLQGVLAYNSVAEMKVATNLVNGSFVQTYGYYAAKDGGGAKYKVREIQNTDVIDDMLLFALNDSNLVAELCEKNEINIKQLGAQESEVDNQNDIKDYLECAFDNFNKIIVPNGTYFLTEFEYEYHGVANKIFMGEGNSIIYTTTGISFKGQENQGYANRIMKVHVKDLTIYGGRDNAHRRGIGLSFNWFGECYIENCYFCFLDYGLKCLNGSEMEVRNTISLGNNYGLYFERPTTNENCDLDAVSLYNCPISNNTHNIVVDSVRGISFNDCIIANGKNVTSYGIEIRNTNGTTNNVNITNCEFENNYTGNPSLLSGTDDETYSGCSILNITNCKFVSYSAKTIQLKNGATVNLTNTIISTEFTNVVSIGQNATDLQINFYGCHRLLPEYVEDLRYTYYGPRKYDDMKLLNFFPDMSRGILEFVVTSSPTYDSVNKNIKFTNSGFLNYSIRPKNYIAKRGLQVIVIGKNLGRIKCVAGGVEYDVGKYETQTLADGSTVIYGMTLRENVSDLRIYFNSNAEISRIEIYGEAPNELPKVGFTSITSQNFIGEPQIGDVISLTPSAATKKLMVWNGTAFE